MRYLLEMYSTKHIIYNFQFCNHLPVHNGKELHIPVARQAIMADPERVYPMSQLYVTVPPNVVLVGVPGDPLVMLGGGPQSTAVRSRHIIIYTHIKYSHTFLHH